MYYLCFPEEMEVGLLARVAIAIAGIVSISFSPFGAQRIFDFQYPVQLFPGFYCSVDNTWAYSSRHS